MSILAENLKTVRKERNFTQAQFAEVLGIGFRTYVRYEVGERDAPISTLGKVALLANLSLEKLLTEKITWLDFYPQIHVNAFESTEIDFLDFRKNLLYLKNQEEPLPFIFDPSEKKFLALFRRMDTEQQDAFCKNYEDFGLTENSPIKGMYKNKKILSAKTEGGPIAQTKKTTKPSKRGRKKQDPKLLQEKIEKLKKIAQSANKTTVK